MLPPWWIRRILLVPLMFVVALAAIVTLPVTSVLAVLVGLITPRAWTRPLRLLLLLVGYLAARWSVCWRSACSG